MRKLSYILLLLCFISSLFSCRTANQTSFAPRSKRESGVNSGGKSNTIQGQGLQGKRKSFSKSSGQKKKSGSGKVNSGMGKRSGGNNVFSVKQKNKRSSGKINDRSKRGFSTGGFFSRGSRERDSYSPGGGKSNTRQKQGQQAKNGGSRQAWSNGRTGGGGKMNDRQKKGFITGGFFARGSHDRESYSRQGGKSNTIQREGLKKNRGTFRESYTNNRKWGGGKMNARQKKGFLAGGFFARGSHDRNSYSRQGGKSNTIQREGLKKNRGTFRESYTNNRKWGGGKMNARQKKGFIAGGFFARGSRDRDSYSRQGGKRNTIQREGLKRDRGAFRESYSINRTSGGGRYNAVQKKGMVGGFLPAGKRDRDSFSSRAKRNSVENRYSRSQRRVVARTGLFSGSRGRSARDSFSSKRKSKGESFRFSEGQRRVVSKKQLFLFNARKRTRDNDSFSTRKQAAKGSYEFSSRQKKVTKARTLFNLFGKRERFDDSYSAPANRRSPSYKYNAKERKVKYQWNPLRPRRERETSSFGGRKLKTYKHYVYDAKNRQVKHRKGFFFKLFDRIQNPVYKPKKKKKELELWDPKMRRHLKGQQ
jgi:hypothetical protein